MKKFTTLFIILLILLSFLMVDWDTNGLHGNGFDNIKEILSAAVHPDFSVIPDALSAAIITLVYATSGLSIAIIMGLTLSLVATTLLPYTSKMSKLAYHLLTGMRAIHELVWALFFVASIGLKPMAAVMAIAIPYGGMLGKVYSSLLTQVDQNKIEALRQSGAGKMQLIAYGYLPEAYTHMVSYTLYRFECAIRSSSILSFVGLGGLGLKIQLTLGDLQYEQTFLYVYALIVLVLALDFWGNLHRKNTRNDRYTGKIIFLLITVSWLYVGIVDKGFFDRILTASNLRYSTQFIKQLLGFNHRSPAFFNLIEIKKVTLLAFQTLQMSILAIVLSGVGMILTVILATRQYARPWVYVIVRGSYLISRAIPELIWAILLVFVFKPGIWVGALALAMHNYGILSKLCAEVIEDLNKKPLENLISSGASQSQLLILGVLPMAADKIITYIIYRWEIILRTTLIVGFIGAGGLGYYFKLNMSLFHYTHVTLSLIAYFLLVKLTDNIAVKLIRLYTH